MSFAAPLDEQTPSTPCVFCGRPIANATEPLSRTRIAPAIIGLIPESVARENNILPYDINDSAMLVLIDIAAPSHVEIIDKLRFLVGKRITCVHANFDTIRAAIDRDYQTRT